MTQIFKSIFEYCQIAMARSIEEVRAVFESCRGRAASKLRTRSWVRGYGARTIEEHPRLGVAAYSHPPFRFSTGRIRMNASTAWI
jgi:hypothetical protein